jgi:DNA-binding NarL/FixJ family response regulator
MTNTARLVQLTHRGSDRAAVVALAEELLRSPTAGGAHVLHDCVLALIHAGDLVRAQQHLDRRGDRAHADVRLVLSARIAVLTLCPARTVERLKEVLPGITPWLRSTAIALLVCCLVDLGRLEEALDVVLAHDCDSTAAGLFARGRLNEAQGHHERAYADFLAVGRIAADITNPAVLPWCSAAARNAHAAGRYVVARSLAQRELVAARRWGDPRTIGRALHAVALTGERANAVERLAEAVRLLTQAGVASELFAARHHYAQALAAQDRHAEAAEICSGTQALSANHPVWTERTAELAARLQRLRRLTAQEIHVATLARVRSNKEIAAELGVTTRTVELHLSQVYRKLGISGRRELDQVILGHHD